ncbi:MAG: hypothetical protein ACJ76N_31745 [Thermoanaerobaculia bacterium]
MSPARRSLVGLLWALALAVPVLPAAPQSAPGPREVVTRAYTFKYQRASEAVVMVYPLLSPKGTVELQPSGNTLVIRDTVTAVQKIMPALRAYDHPSRSLRLEIYVVKASRATVSPQVQRSDLPEDLTKRLRGLFAYDNFEKQAQAQLAGAEGQWVVYELGPDYKVSFRFGSLTEDRQVKLSSFRIARREEGKAEAVLLHANLMLPIDHTTSLGIASSESSPEALMVVLTLREGEAPRK